MIHPQWLELAYCSKTYNEEQLRPHAEACERGECKSYIHCFFGIPQDQRTPTPICAASILKEKRNERLRQIGK